MVTVIVPEQDPRYEDSGRREAVINGHSYPCAITELPDDHPDRKRASHIVTTRTVALRTGQHFYANGRAFVVAQSRDPNRTGPQHMQRRFVEILCNPATS
jgi:hypothetical protein